jgi:3-oxosteroid 1-dehydrogenase
MTDYDLIILGSGAGGLVAALAAAERGLRTLVLEKRKVLGGSTAVSSGVVWLPNNALLAESGVFDSLELARTYLDCIVDSDQPWTSVARKAAFLDAAPRVHELLATNGVGLRFRRDGYPDYYSHRPGGLVGGRALEPTGVPARDLGHWLDSLPPYTHPVVAYATEMPFLKLGFRTWKGRRTLTRAVARTAYSKIPGRAPVTMGRSLVGQLLRSLEQHGVEIRTGVDVTDLVRTGEAVTGVLGISDGRQWEVTSRAVLLATGGFGKNAEMRRQYSPAPVDGQWSAAQDGDTGGGILLAQKHGAAVAEMDEAWWEPAVVLPGGKPVIAVAERFLPHSFMVDGSGHRYMNEAAPYVEAGQAMLRRHRETPAVPSWLIFDARYHNRYVFLTQPPRYFPRSWYDQGVVRKASDLRSLATACDLDPNTLLRTVERFNDFARKGIDADFGRGSNAYSQYYADPRHKPNPTLGTVQQGPFYAVPIYPGDVGTCGGIVTDEHARALTPEGSPIEGLYAAGNSAAPVFGANYPGAGASIGHAMAFGLRAAEHVARDA